jgi:hypothetical protein
MPRRINNLTPEETGWLAEARARRLTAVQAEAAFPRSRDWFRRRGVKGSRGRAARIDPAQARALREEGLTWAEVGKQLGCSPRGASTAALRS